MNFASRFLFDVSLWVSIVGITWFYFYSIDRIYSTPRRYGIKRPRAQLVTGVLVVVVTLNLIDSANVLIDTLPSLLYRPLDFLRNLTYFDGGLFTLWGRYRNFRHWLISPKADL